MTATSCPISSKSPRASLRLENHPSIKGEFVWWEFVSCCPWPAALWLCDELKRSIYNSTFIKHAIWLIQLWDEHSVRLNCLNYTTMWGTNDKKKKKKRMFPEWTNTQWVFWSICFLCICTVLYEIQKQAMLEYLSLPWRTGCSRWRGGLQRLGTCCWWTWYPLCMEMSPARRESETGEDEISQM